MEENQFNTGGIIKWETEEELNKFIKQTDGFIITKEEQDRIIELLNNYYSGNVEISIPQL